MFSFHWFWSCPTDKDSGDMPLKAGSLAEAKREARAVTKGWPKGWLSLTIHEDGKPVAEWSRLNPTWEVYNEG